MKPDYVIKMDWLDRLMDGWSSVEFGGCAFNHMSTILPRFHLHIRAFKFWFHSHLCTSFARHS